jgi:probable HAF family extracellular repeat protein
MCRAFVLLALLAGGIACGHALAQETQFAYVASPNADSLQGFRIDSVTGELTPVPGSPFANGQFGNNSIVIDQAGRFVYVVSGEGNVVGYRIERSGRLSPIPGGPFVVTHTEALAIDPSGKYAYAAQFAVDVFDVSVAAYRIDPFTGQLIALPGPPLPAAGDQASITVDPLGKFVYVPNQTSDTVSAFSINPANGTLTAIPGSPFTVGVGPQSISIDSLDRFAYVAGASNTYAFSINATTGALTALTPPSYSAGNPFEQTVDPRGKFVYVAAGSGVYGYNIVQNTTGPASEAGDLTTVAGSPFGPSTGSGDLFPVSVAVDYTGTFAYAPYYLGGVVGFKINAGTGALTVLPGSPFATAGSPPTIALARPRSFPMYAAKQIPEPALGPFSSFTGSAINNKGEVTGQAVLAESEFLAETFLYNGTTTSGFFVPGSNVSAGNALNDKGEIVGTYTGVPIFPFLLLTQSFLYRGPGVIYALDPRVGGQSAALGINNAEHITGSISTGVCTFSFGLGCTSLTGLGNTHAFLDIGLGPTDIGTLGGNFSEGAGINQHDEVVGGSNVTSNGPNHVFVYSHGSFHDVGMFENYPSVGTAINDKGQIVGTATEPSGTPIGFVHRDGWFERLRGLDGGKTSLPGGINLQGDVVGTSDVASGGASHAFLYSHGKLIDLNNLVEPSLTLLTGATGINDQGQIVANGLNGAVYVLTPICDFPF